MANSHALQATSIASKMLELSMATPHVMAHRMTRMAMAGASPSDRDRKEFGLMVSEKQSAFLKAGTAMMVQTVIANQSLALAMTRAFWSPIFGRPGKSIVADFQSAALGVLVKGLVPIHRTPIANSTRLASTPLLMAPGRSSRK